MRAFYWQLLAAVGFAIVVLISVFVLLQSFTQGLEGASTKGQKQTYVFTDCPTLSKPTQE